MMPPTNFSRMNTAMTEFLNSDHPVVTQLRKKIACKELGQLETNFSCFKSALEASFLLGQGNEAYHLKEYDEALRYFNESVATAPINSLELATAFASRSWVLFDRERYNLCLLDINRALSANVLDASIEDELITRKHDCWSKLQTSRLPEEIKEKLEYAVELYADERQLLYNSKLKMNIDETDLKMDYESFDDPIWNTKLNNATLPDASSKVVVIENPYSHEWQLVATENIEPGEVLFIREYLTVEVQKEARYTFCSYCTLWCEALIPCHSCCREMYCSESCRREAYDLYHRTECKVCWLLLERRIGWPTTSLLPLRLFLTGTRQGVELANLMHDPNVIALMDGPCRNFEVYTSTDNYNKYLATLSTLSEICCDNLDIDRRRRFLLLDNVVSTITALRNINFFNNEEIRSAVREDDISTSSNLEIFAALLLLQHMRTESTILAEVLTGKLYEKKVGQRGVCTQKDIGAGVVNVHDLMNHSCDSNTGLIQNRRRLLIYSSRPILQTEQIYSALAPNYTTQTLKEREQTLQARGVKCSCEACKNNWPQGRDLLRKKKEYLTANKEIIEDIERLHKWFSRGFDRYGLVYEQLSDEFARAALTSIKKIRQYVKEPSSTNLVCGRLIQEHMRWKGNFYLL